MAKEAHPITHWLIYGPPGSGKSSAVLTWPKPILIFMFDPIGKDTVYFQKADGEPRGTVNVPNKDVKQLMSTKGKLLAQLEYFHDSMPLITLPAELKGKVEVPKPDAFERFLVRYMNLITSGEIAKWKTIVFDSITAMELSARNLSRFKMNPTARDGRQHYGFSTDMLETVLVQTVGSLNVNVVALAHVASTKDDNLGSIMKTPAAPGRLASSQGLPAAYGEIYRAFSRVEEDGEEVYYWQTHSDAEWISTTRANAPNPCVADYRAIWTQQTAPTIQVQETDTTKEEE